MKNGGYELVVAPKDYPGKKYRGRYCYEHHLVWWENTGTIPKHDEVIHHVNENKRENRFENLEKKKRTDHDHYHGSRRKRQIVTIKCPSCGTVFEREARQTHLKKPANLITLCSRSCIGTFFHKKRTLSNREKERMAKKSIIKIETRVRDTRVVAGDGLLTR